MSQRRPHINKTEKLAAVLCQMLKPDGQGGFTPVIPHEEAKTLTAEEVLSRFQWDHWPHRHVDGGPTVHWNLTPRLVADHGHKTAKIDIPEIAKTKRITREQERFRAVVTARAGQGEPPPPRNSKWPSRPFPKREKRRMDGTVERRDGR